MVERLDKNSFSDEAISNARHVSPLQEREGVRKARSGLTAKSVSIKDEDEHSLEQGSVL